MTADFLLDLRDLFLPFLPFVVTVFLGLLIIYLIWRRFQKRAVAESGLQFRQQMTLICLGLALVVVTLIALPISNELRGQLFSLFGLLVSAIIALSSTTIVGNVMAGIMLRVVGSFRIGDFIQVADHVGRVSEMGLMHVEIQNDERQLITLPNTYMVSQSVSVVRSCGAIIYCDLSLGYDVPHKQVQDVLVEAAKSMDLVEPAVYIQALGDFSINYRVAGLLEEVKYLVSTRSQLHAKVIDALHAEGIEIASPTLMNSRVYTPEHHYIAQTSRHYDEDDEELATTLLEMMAFDKAERAESIERLKSRYKRNKELIAECNGMLKGEFEGDMDRDEVKKRLKRLLRQNERLSEIINPPKNSEEPG